MTRRILCKECGHGWDLHSEDRARGVQMRANWITLGAVPAGHGMTIIAEGGLPVREALSSIHCDLCNNKLPAGERAIAVTTWRSEREPEPDSWEDQFGKVDF